MSKHVLLMFFNINKGLINLKITRNFLLTNR